MNQKIVRQTMVLFVAILMLVGVFFVVREESIETTAANQTSSSIRAYSFGKSGLNNTKIYAIEKHKKKYLMLPSGTDVENVPIYFEHNGSKKIYFDGENVTSGMVANLLRCAEYDEDKSVYRLDFQIQNEKGKQKQYPVYVMISDCIPSLYLISDDADNEGRAYIEATPDHSNTATGKLSLVSDTGTILCEQRMDKIRIRGNLTSSADKKAYQIKLHKKEDLLFTGQKTKNFGLLANAYDTTLQHNTLVYNLGKELGITDSPDCQPVDVYYDGEYVGNYLLTETPEMSESGANLAKGSYFMQLDYSHYQEREYYLELSNGMFVTFEDPREVTETEYEHVRQIWENMIACMEYGGVNMDTGKTIEDYLDIDTYARYYLLQQLSKNPDGFSSSTYCYIKAGEEKIYFAIPWDFDLCFGCDKQLLRLLDSDGYYPDNTGTSISHIPVVAQRIKEIYQNELRPIIDDILLSEDAMVRGEYVKSLAGYLQEIQASQKMNYVVWPYNQVKLTKQYESFEEAESDFVRFVEERDRWMYQEICNWQGTGKIQKISLDIKEPIAGLPLKTEVDLSSHWQGGFVLHESVDADSEWFDADREYEYAVIVRNGLGAEFAKDLEVETNLGTVVSVEPSGDGNIEVKVNVGMPRVKNTVYQGIDYEPVYNKEYYLAHYPEVAQEVGTSDEAVIQYFVEKGMAQAHKACEDFDVLVYIARYQIFDGLPYEKVYKHYLVEGIYADWSGKK